MLPLRRAESAVVGASEPSGHVSCRSSRASSVQATNAHYRRANSDSVVTFNHSSDLIDELGAGGGGGSGGSGAGRAHFATARASAGDVDMVAGEVYARPKGAKGIARGNSDGKMLSKDSRREGLIAGMRRLFLGMGGAAASRTP